MCNIVTLAIASHRSDECTIIPTYPQFFRRYQSSEKTTKPSFTPTRTRQQPYQTQTLTDFPSNKNVTPVDSNYSALKTCSNDVKRAIWPVMNNVSRCVATGRLRHALCSRNAANLTEVTSLRGICTYSARFRFQSPSPSFIYDGT